MLIIKSNYPRRPTHGMHAFQEAMTEFEYEGKVNNKERLLLSAAVAAGKDTIDTAYEVDIISQ